MRITTKNLGETNIRNVVEAVSVSQYHGNIKIESLRNVSGNVYQLKLGTNDSRAMGSRITHSGRHGKYLCWHGFRDVIAAIMLADEKARVSTGVEVYRGARDFLGNFESTADQNIGSYYQPLSMIDACVDCDNRRINGVFDIALNARFELVGV